MEESYYSNFEGLDSEIIYNHLRSVCQISFTAREIDCIACILAGRKVKKIGMILSIAPKTVENHIYNIMQKLGCSYQDNIIDFVEKSGQIALFKKHYSSIVLQSKFISELQKIGNNLHQEVSCLVLYRKEEKENFSLTKQLQKDLKLAGVNIEHRPNPSPDSNFFPKNENLSDQSIIYCLKDSIILTTPSIQMTDLLLNEQKNYYFLVFNILKNLLPKCNVEERLQEFKNQYRALAEPFVVTIVEGTQQDQLKKEVRPTAVILGYLKHKPLIFGASVILVIVSLSFFGIYLNHPPTKENSLKDLAALKSNKIKPGRSFHWNLPRQDHPFVGREKALQALRLQLEGGASSNSKRLDNTLALSACAGLGGVGKTQLALQYAYATQHPYLLIGWFPAENMDHLQQKYVEFAKSAGFTEADVSTKEAIAYVKRWLTEHPGWLLVYDNVNSYEEIVPFLPEGGGNIILTTRQRNWPSNFKVLDVDIMTEADAIHLLKSKIQNKVDSGDPKNIKELVKLLGYLPLAIAQAGATIEENHLSISEYLTLYKLYEQQMLRSKPLSDGTNSLPIANTWKVTLSRIAKEIENKNELYALNLLTACAYLAPEKIPKRLLLTWFKEVYPHVPSPELILTKTIAQLWKYSLISIDHNDNIVVHRLVQAVLRYQHGEGINEEDYEFPLLTQNWYKLLLIAIHKEFDLKTDVAEDEVRQQGLLPHLQTLINYHDAIWPELTNQITPHFDDVLEDLGLVFSHLGITKTAVSYYNRALNIREKQFGKNHINVAECLTKLGMAHRTLGEALTAKELLERALQIKEKYYEKDHIALALTLTNLGYAYKDLGDARKGKAFLERALNIQEKYYDKDHLEIAHTVLILSNVYGFLGDAKTQKIYGERALKIFERKCGSEHPEVATALSYIAYAYQAMGDPKTAKKYLERSLEIRENFYGKKHQRVARIKSYLSSVYRDLKDPKKAVALAEEALKIKEDYYRPEHPELGKTLLPLGGAYGDLKEYDKGKTYLQKALAINEKYYGKDHTEVGKVIVALVPILRNLNQLADAQSLASRAYDIFLNFYGKDNPYTKQALNLCQNPSNETLLPRISNEAIKSKEIRKKVLIISCGLAGTGKSTHLEILKKSISNSVHIDKDTIATALIPRVDISSPEYKLIKDKVYDVMLKLADLNLNQNKVVILEGYFGNKLTAPLLKNYINSPNFETKIIYFHSSGLKQKERLEARAKIDEESRIRDQDKLGSGKFDGYRLEHITSHMVELTQVPFLMVDTENDADLPSNIQKIIQYIEEPTPKMNRPTVKTEPVKTKPALSISEANGDAKKFQDLLKRN